MAKISLGATLSLNSGNFFTNMKSAVSAAGGLKSALVNTNSALKNHNSIAASAGNTLKSLAGKVVGVVAAYASISAIKNFGTACIAAANAQTEAEKRLETTMMNVQGTTIKQIDSIKKYAAELQGLTTVGDEVSIMGASQLATFQLQHGTIKTLMPALNDLAVAQYGVAVSGDQMKSMANLVGKVMTGNVSSLSRYGVVMDETQKKILQTGTESQKAAILVDVLGQNFGGLAAAMANTPEGRIQQLKNAWGDVQEVIGMQLYPVVTKMLTYMTDKIPLIQQTITGMVNVLQPAFNWFASTAVPTIGSAIESVISVGVSIYSACAPALSNLGTAFLGLGSSISDAFSGTGTSAIQNIAENILPSFINVVSSAVNVTSFLVSNFEGLAPILAAVSSAVLAYNTAIKIETALNMARVGATSLLNAAGVANTATLTAMSGATFAHTAAASAGAVATWALNSALAVLTSPVTLVIASIAALSAVFVVLWKRCDGFRNFFIGLWEEIKKTVTIAYNYIKSSLTPLIDTIKASFQSAWSAIKVVWDYVQPYFQTVWNSVKQIFSVVQTYIGGAFKTAFTTIKASWDTAIGYFTAIWSTIKGLFSVVKSVFSGDFKGAWDAIKSIFAAWGDFFGGLWNSIISVFSAVGSWFGSTFSAAWNAVKNIFAIWGDFFSGLWTGIVNIFSAVGSWFGSIFSGAWEAVKNAFSGVIVFFQNIWNNIKTMFTNIGISIADGISGAFKSVINSVVGFAEVLINKFINGINSSINTINLIPGVNIQKLQTVSFPKLAKGGIITSATYAQIGEAGDEAVLPLAQFWDRLNKSINDRRKNEYITSDKRQTANNITVNVYTNNKSDTDMAEIVAKVIIDKIENM